MKFDNLNRWLTLAGNVGVILGILFLAIELQQANRIAVATAEADIRSKYMDLGKLDIESPELAEALVTLMSSQEDLTPVQDRYIRSYVRNTSVFFMAVESAHDNGLISLGTFDSYSNVAARTIQNQPNLAPYFLTTFEVRPESEVDNVMVKHILQVARLTIERNQ